MSMGYGGNAEILFQDEILVLYKYYSYNLNDPLYKNDERVFDGLIFISKDSLVKPEMHKKIKRMPSGRKKPVLKYVLQNVDYELLFETGKIKVENSKFCWNTLPDGTDMTAMHIIQKIFTDYQRNNSLPETVSYNV